MSGAGPDEVVVVVGAGGAAVVVVVGKGAGAIVVVGKRAGAVVVVVGAGVDDGPEATERVGDFPFVVFFDDLL